jgi:hypothetical protein
MLRAVTSASNIHRRALCPGSERLEAGLSDEDSAQSLEGTLLHSYDANPKLERAVLKPQQQHLLRISNGLDEFIFAYVSEKFSIPGSEPFQEGRERELCAMREREDETPGHCDRWRLYPSLSLLVIIDKKFGFKEVTPAAANYQLRTYAIAGAEEWHPENIVVAITQPRLPYEQRLTMASYSSKDIEFARAELMGIRAASRRDDAPLVAGEEQCRYCKAKLVCSAYRATLQQGFALVPVENGTVALRQAQVEKILAACNDDQLDQVLVYIQRSDFVKDMARDEARFRVKSGRLANWQLGKASETRNITDPRRAISLLILRGELSRDEILGCCEPQLNAIEEKLRAKKKCTWQVAKETIESTLEPVLERGTRKASLTRKKNGKT